MSAAAFSCWLWWDWWVLEYGRSEPWLALLCWWGDVTALLACLWALARGTAFVVPADRTAARWATVGVAVSLLADLGATGLLLARDHHGFARSIPAIGQPSAVQAGSSTRSLERGDVLLTIEFPTPGAESPSHVGGVKTRLAPPAIAGERNPLQAWISNELWIGQDPRIPTPAVPVRYDPEWPGRFWLAGQEWTDFSPGRLAVVLLPVIQIWSILFGPLDALADRFAGRKNYWPSDRVDEFVWATTGPARAAVVSLPILFFTGLFVHI
ncbi:hypothetical protein [Alienimonas chondri]|uniref:Uncharacterized protein n=1 Tax=Alienimonas chondri TaxID=2681879 RepID=A0ABX1VDD1_9PLAN|nr:hypothetical protein [Alienimonas chondri]NNJ25803.1 hypothetical protein [Alienimonas chondri]